MIVVKLGYPRSANTFLSDLIRASAPRVLYYKIPREFPDYGTFETLAQEHRHDGAIYLLGHDHMNDWWEYRVCRRLDVPAIMPLRDPLSCITSHLVYLEAKTKTPDSCFTFRHVIREVLSYSRFFYVALALKLLRRRLPIVGFDDLTTNPVGCMGTVADWSGLQLDCDERIVETGIARRRQKYI